MKYYLTDSWEDYSEGYKIDMVETKQITEEQYSALLAFMLIDEQALIQLELKPKKDHKYSIYMQEEITDLLA